MPNFPSLALWSNSPDGGIIYNTLKNHIKSSQSCYHFATFTKMVSHLAGSSTRSLLAFGV